MPFQPRQDAVARDALMRLWAEAEVNRLTNISTRCRGLVTDDGSLSDLPFGAFADRAVYVVDVANLEEDAQDLIFTRIVSQLRERLESRTLGVEHVVVFVDELSRTRPDLQNKLFSIIHERRVQGIPLEKLRYRWAAMNPPPAAGDDADDDGDAYLGAEPLDPALADRFAFLLEVPGWAELTDAEKTELLNDQFRGRHEFPVDVPALVARTRERLSALTARPPALAPLPTVRCPAVPACPPSTT